MKRAELIREITDRIDALRPPHPTRVGIDGVDAAGKTTLADELAVSLRDRGRPVICASVDRFHHPARIRKARGPESAEGYYRDSFDYRALIRCLLEPLGPGGSLEFRAAAFDFRTDSRVDEPLRRAAPDSVLVFDGVFLHRPELVSFWDLSIFVEARFAVTVGRAERRDASLFGSAQAVRQRYASRYVPGQRLYLAECRPREQASWVVGNDDPENPTLDSLPAPAPAP